MSFCRATTLMPSLPSQAQYMLLYPALSQIPNRDHSRHWWLGWWLPRLSAVIETWLQPGSTECTTSTGTSCCSRIAYFKRLTKYRAWILHESKILYFILNAILAHFPWSTNSTAFSHSLLAHENSYLLPSINGYYYWFPSMWNLQEVVLLRDNGSSTKLLYFQYINYNIQNI